MKPNKKKTKKRCTIHSETQIIFRRGDTGDVVYSGGDPSNEWNLMLLSVPVVVCVIVGILLVSVVVVVGVIVRRPSRQTHVDHHHRRTPTCAPKRQCAPDRCQPS